MKFISKLLNKSRYAAFAILTSLALQSSSAVFAMQSSGNMPSSNTNTTDFLILPPAILKEIMQKGNVSVWAFRLISKSMRDACSPCDHLKNPQGPLTQIPDNISKNLVSLSLTEDKNVNKLVHLKVELPQLEELVIKHCQNFDSQALVNIVLHCPKLRILNLSDNRLVVLSPDRFTGLPALSLVGLLTNLQALNLSGNNLITLPVEIGNLKNLQELNLADNQFIPLPSVIGKLANLKWLNLCNNKLTALPKMIGNLKNLTSLNLNINELSALPKEISNLTNLQVLYLSGNQLTDEATQQLLAELIVRGVWVIAK